MDRGLSHSPMSKKKNDPIDTGGRLALPQSRFWGVRRVCRSSGSPPEAHFWPPRRIQVDTPSMAGMYHEVSVSMVAGQRLAKLRMRSRPKIYYYFKHDLLEDYFM